MAGRSRFPTSSGEPQRRPSQGQRVRAIIVKDPDAPHHALVRMQDNFVIATARSPEILSQMARERGYPASEVRLYDEGPAPQSAQRVHDAYTVGVSACRNARNIEAQALVQTRDIKDAAYSAIDADRDLTAKAAELDAAGVSKEPLHQTSYARASLIRDPNAPPGTQDKYLLVQEGRVLHGGRGTIELSIWAAQNGYGIVNDMHDRPPTNPAEAKDWQAAQEHFSRARIERLAQHPEMQADATLALGGPSVGQDMDLWAAAVQHGGEDGPEAALGIEPPTPSDRPGDSDSAAAEIELGGPTESSDRGPESSADGPDLDGPTVQPGPENSIEAIAAATAHMSVGDMKALGWSDARISMTISTRTFPDAHRAALEPERGQIAKARGKQKTAKASKVLKKGKR